MKKTSRPNPTENLGYISSATALIASDPLKALTMLQIQLSEDLQLIEKTGNQKRAHISRGDQQAYYLQVFQRLY